MLLTFIVKGESNAQACINAEEINKTTATGPVWICSTYNSCGKAYCLSKAIPEEKLMQAAAQIGHMFELGELGALPLTFDEKLWNGTVDHVTVYPDERVVFRFKDGKEITTRL